MFFRNRLACNDRAETSSFKHSIAPISRRLNKSVRIEFIAIKYYYETLGIEGTKKINTAAESKKVEPQEQRRITSHKKEENGKQFMTFIKPCRGSALYHYVT